MSNSLLVSIVAGAVAGVAGAAATSVLLLDTEPSLSSGVAASVRPVAASGEESADLRQDLERLRTENRMLSERLRLLEERPVPTESTRQAIESEPDPAVARLEDQMRQLLTAMTDTDAPIPAGLAESFREVYEDIQDEERAEREQRREDARELEMTARMERYAVELGLDEYQSNEMRVILTESQDRRDALIAEARENGTFMNMRDEMRALQDEAEEALGNVLTSDQMGQLREMEGDRFGGFGGGRRGGGGPGGGGRRGG